MKWTLDSGVLLDETKRPESNRQGNELVMVVQLVLLVVEPVIYKPVAQNGEILATDPKYNHNKGLQDQAIQKIHATISRVKIIEISRNRIAEIKG